MLKARFKKGKDLFKNTYTFFIFGLPQMKKINFFDFFNFSEICVIFAQICIFWPFSFFKRVLKGFEKYMVGKTFVKDWPMNICFSS